MANQDMKQKWIMDSVDGRFNGSGHQSMNFNENPKHAQLTFIKLIDYKVKQRNSWVKIF